MSRDLLKAHTDVQEISALLGSSLTFGAKLVEGLFGGSKFFMDFGLGLGRKQSEMNAGGATRVSYSGKFATNVASKNLLQTDSQVVNVDSVLVECIS